MHGIWNIFSGIKWIVNDIIVFVFYLIVIRQLILIFCKKIIQNGGPNLYKIKLYPTFVSPRGALHSLVSLFETKKTLYIIEVDLI